MIMKNVNPGDLITAQDWNDLVELLNALDVRVSDLETGGSKTPPRITQVLPTGIRTAGDIIRIYGANFGFTQGAHSVSFGNTPAESSGLGGSSDSLLIVPIPDNVEGANEAGTTITMNVGNLYGFTSWALTIKSKPIVISGGVQLTYLGSTPTTPTQNAVVQYNFELKSFASENLVVTITPDIQVLFPLPAGVTDPGLGGLLTVNDSDGSVSANRQINLAEGATKTISLRLSLPNNMNNLRYSLSASASANGIPTVVESLPDQQVGQAGEQPDPTVNIFEFSSIALGQGAFSTNTGGVLGVDGTLTVKQGTTVTIKMRTGFSNIPVGITNNYDLTATTQLPSNGWSASVNPETLNPLAVLGPGGLKDIFFDVTAPASTNTANLQLTLTRQGAATNNKRMVAYRLITTP